MVLEYQARAALRLVQSVVLAVASLDRERRMLTRGAPHKDSRAHTVDRAAVARLVHTVPGAMLV